MTDNELIAQFMGDKDVFLYDVFWDQLMRVVEKINNTIHPILNERIDVIIYRRTCHINDMQQIMIEATGNNMLDCTYKAVVEFIKWYNQKA